jgi:hypothetical protein
MGRCDAAAGPRAAPADDAMRAGAAALRLDDTFRTFLAERGTKHASLADVTSLVTGVAGLRLASEAVLDLWSRDHGDVEGDRTTARRELVRTADRLIDWYQRLGESLSGGGAVPDPLPPDGGAEGRLLDALSRDLTGRSHRANATAIRMIWTGDHLDAARRLQHTLVAPARAATRRNRVHAPGPPPLRATAHDVLAEGGIDPQPSGAITS